MNNAIRAGTVGDQMWGKKSTFVLAAAGSAVGLGNIWRFPYALAENGGSAFLLIYLLCIFGICVPIMMAETLIGRIGRGSPVLAFHNLADRRGKGRPWVGIGFLGVAGSFIIGAFYTVVCGWVLAYTLRSLLPDFPTTEGEVSAFFETVTSYSLGGWDVLEILMHSLFLLLCLGIVYQGVVKGLERYLRPMVPLLVLLLLVGVAYAINIGNTEQALAFMFSPDFSKITGETVLAAVGHAFFSLSLGMGVFITYGAYTPSNLSLGKMVLLVSAIDTTVAVLAGLMVFPLVFAIEGVSASAGPGLVFLTIPFVFTQMPLGDIARFLFFLLLLIAGVTSMVSLIEPAVSALEHYRGMTRHRATAVVIGGLWVFGAACAQWSGLFDAFDYLTTKILLPVGGMLIALFVGWGFSNDLYADQEGVPTGSVRTVWIWTLRVVAPATVAVILVAGLWPSA